MEKINAESNEREVFYQKSLERIANAAGITDPIQLIARAENNTETYVDILVRVIEELRLSRPA